MTTILCYDLHNLLQEAKVSLDDFPLLDFWISTYENTLSIALSLSMQHDVCSKFYVAGYFLHSVILGTETDEEDILDVTNISSDFLSKARLGLHRLSHDQLRLISDTVFAEFDKKNYEASSLAFFLAYRQALLLDMQRNMLSQYVNPIREFLSEKFKEKERRKRRKTIKQNSQRQSRSSQKHPQTG